MSLFLELVGGWLGIDSTRGIVRSLLVVCGAILVVIACIDVRIRALRVLTRVLAFGSVIPGGRP